MTSTQTKRNKANRTQVCNLKKETLLLSKVGIVVTTATTAALNWEDVLMLLPTALKKSWNIRSVAFHCKSGHFTDREFYWSADHEFYTRLGIWNGRSVWSTDRFVRKFILLHKNESFLEKNQFYWSIFFQASQNPVRKRKVSKTEVVIQSLAIKCYHELHLSFHKDLEMLILAAPFLLLIKKIL